MLGPAVLGRGRDDPLKHVTPPHVTIPDFVAVSKTVWARQVVPKSFGDAWAPALWNVDMADP